MPTYEITATALILADSEKEAKMGFAQYVGGDLDIECFEAKEELSNDELFENIRKGYDSSEFIDWYESVTLKEKVEELEEEI